MKKFSLFLSAILVTLFVGCSGSDTYRGNWKAIDNGDGEKILISFDANTITMTDSKGKKEKFEYTQNSVSVENSVETYGIQLKKGGNFFIHFPIADDETVGLIKDDEGRIIYSIGRKEYVNPGDINKF